MKIRRMTLRILAASLALAFVVSGASVAMAVPVLSPLTVTASGKTFTHPTPSSLLVTTSTADAAAIAGWVSSIAAAVDVSPVNPTRKIVPKKRKVTFTAGRTGFKLDQSAAANAIAAELIAAATTDPARAPQTLALAGTETAPKALGKTIMVVLKYRKVYLYNEGALEKSYRIAIGQAAFPTPTGTFTIARKVKGPTWTNPGSAWAKGMPSFIGPSINNPLGTRALYVYKGKRDTGVRFHGVPASKNYSIGSAASHGCMRMKRKDVENFYPRVPVGTVVYIVK